ncbi:MAG: hypothetical protein EBT95_00010 [Verrucomicrobia bacterium]|nr:hypothetical protein [Verrucomicrobiota bacterium]
MLDQQDLQVLELLVLLVQSVLKEKTINQLMELAYLQKLILVLVLLLLQHLEIFGLILMTLGQMHLFMLGLLLQIQQTFYSGHLKMTQLKN